jgi:hypothetical protein
MTVPEYTTITEDSASSTADERRGTETNADQTADPSARVETLGRDDKSKGVEILGRDDDQNERGENHAGAPPLSPAVGDRVGTTTPNPVKLCQHAKADGVFCGRPALRERLYCYQHLRLRGQQMRMARARAQRLSCPLMLPALDDLDAVKVALTQVSYALALGQLEHRRAGLLIYALQQASSLMWRMELIKMNSARSPSQSQPEADEQKRRVEEYPGFEAEFGLPADIDLTKPPEALFPLPTVEATGENNSQPGSHPQPHPAWTAEDIALEQLDKLRPHLSEKAYAERSRQIHDRMHKKVQTEIRKEQEAEWQDEADRRNALEEEKARVWKSMDAGQQRAFHLGVVTGIEEEQQRAEEKARTRKPVASGDARVAASGERSNLA